MGAIDLSFMSLPVIPNNLIEYWNKIWGTIGGIALLVGLVVGILALHDRFFPDKSRPYEQVKEYIFGNQYYYVQALVNESNKVVAYGVTTRQANFNPTFSILEDAYSANPDDPSNLEKATPWLKRIRLGITRFSDLNDTPENIVAILGARRFYYHEEYYFGNPGNYQFYFFAANDSAHLETGDPDFDVFNEKHIDPKNPSVQEFRSKSIINTFYITAPMEGFTNPGIRKYLVGPDLDQVRVISESTIKTDLGPGTLKERLQKLSTEVDIAKFIEILGSPIVVNNKPYLEMRDDPILCLADCL